MPERSIPVQPIGGKAAWRGPAMAAERDWVVKLGRGEVAEIDAALASARERGFGPDDFADDPARFPLPRLSPRLAAMRDGLLAETGVALLSGLPGERYDEAALTLILRGIGCHLGVAISQNYKGERLGRVIDVSDHIPNPGATRPAANSACIAIRPTSSA